MKIVIDADATPKSVLKICRRASARFSLSIITVASFNHHIESDRHITVGNNPQETDMEIINMTTENDLVITQDWGLAAMVLGKRAYVLSPLGHVFNEENIGFLLEERELKLKIRRRGGRTKGPRKRTPEDDARFENSLVNLIEKVLGNQ